MAILRRLGIRCRIHGFTIDKKLQKGVMSGIVYKLAPINIVHSWVEVEYDGKWYDLEGLILDSAYLEKLQRKFSKTNGRFCGYAVAVNDFKNLEIEWNINDTYIQKEGINQDFGVYDSPDEFFLEHSQKLNKLKKFVYQNIGRHLMNYKVNKIRDFSKKL